MFALFLYSAPAAFGQCDANEVTLSLTFDSWPEEAGWSITDADGAEVASAAAGDYASVPDGGCRELRNGFWIRFYGQFLCG